MSRLRVPLSKDLYFSFLVDDVRKNNIADTKSIKTQLDLSRYIGSMGLKIIAVTTNANIRTFVFDR